MTLYAVEIVVLGAVIYAPMIEAEESYATSG